MFHFRGNWQTITQGDYSGLYLHSSMWLQSIHVSLGLWDVSEQPATKQQSP